MAKKVKYYVVWVGVTPGIYDTWADCQLQIKGYPGARYKSYPTKSEAQEAYTEGPIQNKAKAKKNKEAKIRPTIADSAIAVDAACSGNPGLLEYQGVLIKDGTLLFHAGPFKQGTNNIGEFLAIVHALAMLEQQKSRPIIIYTDSRTALAWIRKNKANTKLKKSSINAPLFNLIDRAEKWLKTHPLRHKLIKWETKKWGEIPADFGRK